MIQADENRTTNRHPLTEQLSAAKGALVSVLAGLSALLFSLATMSLVGLGNVEKGIPSFSQHKNLLRLAYWRSPSASLRLLSSPHGGGVFSNLLFGIQQVFALATESSILICR
jgi:hypothetical protein